MDTIQHTVTRVGNRSWTEPEECRITLPAPPWGVIEATDRAETAPRSAPIRGRDWTGDRLLVRANKGAWK